MHLQPVASDVPSYYAQVVYLAVTEYDAALTFFQYDLPAEALAGSTQARAVPVARIFLPTRAAQKLRALLNRADILPEEGDHADTSVDG